MACCLRAPRSVVDDDDEFVQPKIRPQMEVAPHEEPAAAAPGSTGAAAPAETHSAVSSVSNPEKSAISSAAASQMQSTISLVAYVLPTPPSTQITAELREYISSDGPRCNAAALLRPAAPYAMGAAELPIPARSITPLLAATLAPLPSSLPQGARMAAIHAILGPSITPATLKHVAPVARAGSYNVLGCALHAATFGACMEPHDFLPVAAAIVDAGGPVDLTLACESASGRPVAPPRSGASAGQSGVLGTTSSSHWLSGGTCLHIVALFGLQHGSAILPLLRTLRDAGASPDVLLHGATALHLACACAGTILPDDASDIVSLLASSDNLSQSINIGSALSGEPSVVNNNNNFGHSPSSIGTSGRHLSLPDPSGPFRQLLPVQEASPLEVAAAAPGDAGAMIEALVANGADVKGECGVRALMICLIAGKRTRARNLLHHGVSVSTVVALQWPPVATPVTDKDSHSYAFSLLPRSVALQTASAWYKFQEAHANPEQPSIHLSPLQLLLVASSGAAKSLYAPAQIRQLFQDALCCLPPGTSMGDVPRLPCKQDASPQPACSATLYMLKYCPLYLTVMAAAGGVDIESAFEDAGGVRVQRNSITALLHRNLGDSKTNLLSAAHSLLDGGVSPSRPDGETGNTVLHELPLGFTPLYAALRDAGADTAARNFAGRTPLHCAAAAGDFQLVRLLLRDGASAIATAHGGETPMHAAAAADAQSAPQLVHCIAAAGGDPDAPDDEGVTPLDVARSMPHGQATVDALTRALGMRFEGQGIHYEVYPGSRMSSPMSAYSPQALNSQASLHSGRASPSRKTPPLDLTGLEPYATTSEEEEEYTDDEEGHSDEEQDQEKGSAILDPSTFREQLNSVTGPPNGGVDVGGFADDNMHAVHAPQESFHSIGSDTEGTSADSTPTVVHEGGSGAVGNLQIPEHLSQKMGHRQVPGVPENPEFSVPPGYQGELGKPPEWHAANGMGGPPGGVFNFPPGQVGHMGPLGGSVGTSMTSASALLDRNQAPGVTAHTIPSAAVVEQPGSSSSSYHGSSSSGTLPTRVNSADAVLSPGGVAHIMNMHDQYVQNVDNIMHAPPSTGVNPVEPFVQYGRPPQPGAELPPLHVHAAGQPTSPSVTSVDAAGDKLKAGGGFGGSLYAAGSGAMSQGDIRAAPYVSGEPNFTATSPVESSAPITMGSAGDRYGGFTSGPHPGGASPTGSSGHQHMLQQRQQYPGSAANALSAGMVEGNSDINRKESVTAFVAASSGATHVSPPVSPSHSPSHPGASSNHPGNHSLPPGVFSQGPSTATPEATDTSHSPSPTQSPRPQDADLAAGVQDSSAPPSPSSSSRRTMSQRAPNTITTATSLSSQQSAKQSIIANANHMIIDDLNAAPSGLDVFSSLPADAAAAEAAAAAVAAARGAAVPGSWDGNPTPQGVKASTPAVIRPPRNVASLHMHQDSVAHDISSALHSIPHPSNHERQDSQATVIVHTSGHNTPKHSALHSLKMSTVGESSLPGALASTHTPEQAPTPIAAQFYAGVTGSGLKGAQYASPPASVDSTAPGMSLASAGGGPSMPEITQQVPNASALNTPQVSTVPSTAPASPSAHSSMFDSDQPPPRDPPSTRTESALNSIEDSPTHTDRTDPPRASFDVQASPPPDPEPPLGPAQSVLVPPGAADSSDVPDHSGSPMTNPAATAPAGDTPAHDAASGRVTSREDLSRSNFLQPVDLPPPPEEPDWDAGGPAKHPPSVLTTQSVAAHKLHTLNTQKTQLQSAGGNANSAMHDASPPAAPGPGNAFAAPPSSRIHSSRVNTRVHTQSEAISSAANSRTVGGGSGGSAAAAAAAPPGYDLDAMLARDNDSNASELAEEDFPVAGELRWNGGAAMPVYNGPSVDDALGRRRSGSQRLQSQNVGEALEHQSRSRVSTGNHPAISSGPRTTGTSRTRPARPSGPTSADGGSTFSGISAAPSATRRKTTEASRPRPAWGDPPGARPSRTRVTGPARASADAGARAPSRAGGAGRSSDSGAPRFTNAVATGPKSAEPKGKKKSVPSYMSNTASSASKRSNNSSLDAAFNSTPANPRPARRTAAHSASPSRMGAFAKAAAPPKGGVSASPSRMGGTLESVRPSAAAPSRRTTTGGAYAARGSRTRSGSGASPSSEGYRAAPPTSVPATHSGDADHGCGYGMAAVDNTANDGTVDYDGGLSSPPGDPRRQRGRSSQPAPSRECSPDFHPRTHTAHSTLSSASRMGGGASRMESSNMGNLRTGGSRMEASRKESTHMGTLRTGGSRMEASRMESSRMEGSHMGALHTGGSRMGGGGSRMDPGRVQAAEIRHPVKQESMSSVPSMSPPEPVGDGAAARTDNSLLSHSTMSQASSPRGSAAEGPQLGDVILNRIIHAGGTAELWEELGDDEFAAFMTQPLPRQKTLLHCLKDGQEHLVRPLMALGLQIDVRDSNGNTPLHAAATSGNAAVLRALINNSADPSARNNKGRTLLHVLKDGQEHLVRPLLAHGLGIDVRDAGGNTPLHTAAAGGQADVLRLLVMNSADPSLRNNQGRDALLCAVCSKVNTLAVVKTLMKLGVHSGHKDNSGRTALDIARQRAGGTADDPVLAFMTRAADQHALQRQRMQNRIANRRGAAAAQQR